MRVHHLNCATMRPPITPSMVAHVLLVERADGLFLVDTGFGTGDIANPKRLGKPFQLMVRPALDPGETAVAQVKALGFSADDVTDIALTHLDLDHAGGIADFPKARIHVHQPELDAAMHPTMREKARYVGAQWAHGPSWVAHSEAGDNWFGFSSVTALGDDVVLIPLIGHTRGHAGVAVRDAEGHWLLHAGDSFFDAQQVQTPAGCNRGLAAFQTLMAVSNKQRRANTELLRELVASHSAEVTVFCAHDKSQYDALAHTAG
ncbi:MBL fold metallo-hydrolase [Nocardioides humilatus]|uniref:MBL fold metallo-hydrolase n=1 Tax=Nocardioides humilatus TaxID=2607660 RepID=A0A5B1LIB4_9ACTN|nr:MBL fold metallo-hydrolase [Nocardioides humilatus]KAA1420166.1 MBL fold metallo-hydrolase [Nocardioides humilatus]